MNILVVGLGYVGLANALFLSRHHNVSGYDIDENKIELLRQNINPLSDNSISDYLMNHKLGFKLLTNPHEAYAKADIIIIATPTDYDEASKTLCIDTVVATIEDVLKLNRKALIVIRSTLPLGTSEKLIHRFNYDDIFFVPEFLREGQALSDSLNPSRIIIGSISHKRDIIKQLFTNGILNNAPLHFVSPTEAEAIKLLSNSYLAMRVAFYNELDGLAATWGLDSKHIIDGLSDDVRIGKGYNNPSFGFSGYCLPKDTKQLSHQFQDAPHELNEAIIKSNEQRIAYIASDILAKKPKVVGIYRLTMKSGSNNIRHSIMKELVGLLHSNVNVHIFEPLLTQNEYHGHLVIRDIDEFIAKSDLIVANRVDEAIIKASDKLYTRDLYHTDK